MCAPRRAREADPSYRTPYVMPEDLATQYDRNSHTIGPFLGRTRIAYFSMEMALHPDMHTYSGGLGVLAGDTARSCADLELPTVFVTLITRLGYLRQELDENGWQIDHPDPWQPAEFATALRAKVAVPIGTREVWVRPWLHVLASPLGHAVPVLLLDTDLPENHPDDRKITDRLYGGDEEYRLKQEIILGIGGLRLLSALGFGEIDTYHLNEGHAALLALDLLRRFPRPIDQVFGNDVIYDVGRVREKCIFTTHTPVEAGHDRFPYALVHKLLPNYMDLKQIQLIAGPDEMNMTLLALMLSGYVNGVAQRHAETTKRMFPGYRIRAVTNGVHLPTWAHPAFLELYHKHYPSWGHEPETLVQADQLPDTAIWNAHTRARQDLIDFVAARTGVSLDPGKPIIGYARRMTSYKRPELPFTDMDALRRVNARYPFQLILSGKAHPQDENGKRHIQSIHQRIKELSDEISIVFLPNYDLTVAKALVPGVDVWLNTPVPPMEASGTSGMKAALNGGLNLSVLDGWWVEACIDGVTGWSIGHDGEAGAAEASAADLYDKLENVVLPLYYQDRDGWIRMMKAAISKIAPYFNTQRMMRRYAAEAYVR
jgi:starch phosphorylase